MPPKTGTKKVATRKPPKKRVRVPSPSPPSSPDSTSSQETQFAHFPWPIPTEEQRESFLQLSKRSISPTRYIDVDALKEVGLYDEVQDLVNGIGWTTFLFQCFPTYKEVTLEFLSSLTSNVLSFERPERVVMSFRCMGEERTINAEQLSRILGLNPDGEDRIHGLFNAKAAWRDLTGRDDYHPSRSKSSHLRRPALRYIHRVLAYSLFGRGESQGVVNKNELFFLYAMVHRVPIYTAMWFIRHALFLKKKEGRICIGGFCTRIANSVGFVAQTGVHSLVRGPNVIDINTLIRLKICQYMDDGRYWLLDANGNPIPPHQDQQGEGSIPTFEPGESSVPPTDQHEGFQQTFSQDFPTYASRDQGPSSHPYSPTFSSSSWTVDSMMAAITGRFDSMETHFDGLHEHLSMVEGAVSSLGTNLQKMQVSVSSQVFNLHQEISQLRAQLLSKTTTPPPQSPPTADVPQSPMATPITVSHDISDPLADAPPEQLIPTSSSDAAAAMDTSNTEVQVAPSVTTATHPQDITATEFH